MIEDCNIGEVGNIHCPSCHKNMWFSPEHSTSDVAVFHCENVACIDFGFHRPYTEVGWDHVLVERIES